MLQKVPISPLKQHALDLRATIEQHGWCRGELRARGTDKYCMMGSSILAFGFKLDVPRLPQSWTDMVCNLGEFISTRVHWVGQDPISPAGFNDLVARNKQDVLDMVDDWIATL